MGLLNNVVISPCPKHNKTIFFGLFTSRGWHKWEWDREAITGEGVYRLRCAYCGTYTWVCDLPKGIVEVHYD